MSQQKHQYELIVNQPKVIEITYSYTYGSIKNIAIQLGKAGMKISVTTSAEMTGDMILKRQDIPAPSQSSQRAAIMFRNAIQKGMMLYLLRYSKPLTIKTLSFSTDGSVQAYSPEDFPVDCMIESKLSPALGENWRSSSVSSFILKYKDHYVKPKGEAEPDYIQRGAHSLMSAFAAYITALSKRYEYERFMFLWMAMNGVYGYASYLYEPSGKRIRAGQPKSDVKEKDQMSILWQSLEISNNDASILKDDKLIIASEVKAVLKNIDDMNLSIEDLKQTLFEGETADRIEDLIHVYHETDKGKSYQISSRLYLTFFLPYIMRCNYFHADRPFPLLAKKNDETIHVLRILNRLLEDFLGEIIPEFTDKKWLINKYILQENRYILK